MASFPFEFPSPLGGDAPSEVTDAADVSTRYAAYIRGKTNAESLRQAFRDLILQVEDATSDTVTSHYIDNATGAQLETLAEIVGQPRWNAPDDDAHRALIRGRIQLNNSSGTPEDIYKIFTALAQPGVSLRIEEETGSAFVLHMVGVLAAGDAETLVYFLREGKPAGVRHQMYFAPVATADVFTLDGTAAQGLDAGTMKGSLV